MMNSDGTDLLKIGEAVEETSGIIDISSFVGYRAGSVFLTSIQTDQAQFGVIVSPNAFGVPEPNAMAMLVALSMGAATRRRRR